MAASPPPSLQLAPHLGGAGGEGPGCLSRRVRLVKVPFSPQARTEPGEATHPRPVLGVRMRACHCFCLPRRSQAAEAGYLPIPFRSEIERGQTSHGCGPAQGWVEVTASGFTAACEQVESPPRPTPLKHPYPLIHPGPSDSDRYYL